MAYVGFAPARTAWERELQEEKIMKVISTVPRSRFEKYGTVIPAEIELSFLSELSSETLMAAQAEAGGILVQAVDTINREFINSCPNLKIIQSEGVGFDKVDGTAARERGIDLCNNRDANKVAVAEQVVCSIMVVLRRMIECDATLKAGASGKEYLALQSDVRKRGLFELHGRHAGILGFGAIGREVARLLVAFGCTISYFDAFPPPKEVEDELGATYRTAAELFEMCDIVSVHVPVLPETINMVNAEMLAKMKPNAVLVNAARGEIVDQYALAEALEKGAILGAAIDTMSPEPPPADHPLLNLSEDAKKRICLNPHVAGTTDEAFSNMLDLSMKNFMRVVNGETPVHIVNK